MNWEIFKFIFFLNDDSESTGKTTGAYFQEDVKLFRCNCKYIVHKYFAFIFIVKTNFWKAKLNPLNQV